MCGIFGFVTVGDRRLAEIDFPAAIRALHHRGPDDSGLWTGGGDSVEVGLAMTRLAILDLSPEGHQPMRSEDGNVTLVYNGELYDDGTLRRELSAAGHRFRGTSDTELLLHGYLEWGAEVVHRLRGMFAFAVWDARRRTLFLARDRLGVKPLYVARGPGWLAFSSEIRALVRAGVVGVGIRPEGLQTFLAFGSVAEPYTMLFHADPHPAAHLLEWTDGTERTRCYWGFPDLETSAGAGEVGAPRLAELLDEAVRTRLASDVPLGLFLSGGVDSGTILAAASRHRPHGIRTLTLSFADAAYDEGAAAKAVAAAFDAQHTDVPLTGAEALEAIPRALADQDQPSLDGLNTWFISRAARQAGLTVALSGVGGDELFAGYHRFAEFAQLSRLAGRLGATLRGPAERLAVAAGAHELPWRWRKALWLATAADAPERCYGALRSVVLPDRIRRLMVPGSVRLPPFGPIELPASAQNLDPRGSRSDPVNLYSMLDLSNYLRNTLLRDADVMSMAHGLEVREPLLDYRLVEAVLRVPGCRKVERGRKKPLLLDAVNDERVREAARRPKRGFALPLGVWMRNDLQEMVATYVDAAIEHAAGLLDAHAVRGLWHGWRDGKASAQWFHVFQIASFGAWAAGAEGGR